MNSLRAYYIGWDVGGWNCDKNGKSRDALVILDEKAELIGQPWRGNLRETLTAAGDVQKWLRAAFKRCGSDEPDPQASVTLAIDAPLGFSDEFVRLVSARSAVEVTGPSASNRYLFRYTERYLFQRGHTPLSAVKDMIGSQSTKAMHFLARFAPQIESCGVFSDGQRLKVIEAYPSVCRDSPAVRRVLEGRSFENPDHNDALFCAVIAYLYANHNYELESPPPDVPSGEGWIWAPSKSSPAI